jgi:hypothetical protein
LDCGFPEASRPMYKRGGDAGQVLLPFCAPQNPSLLLKPFARSPALLAPVRRRSGPRQADRAPPPMVRSYVVFFLVCCKHAAGRFIVRGYLEQCGGGGATCWGEGRDATLRSSPFAAVAGLTKTKRAGTPFASFSTRRRPAVTSPRGTASSCSEAHVRSGPL